MQNKTFRFGPIALSSTLTTNILNPGTTTGGIACTSSPYANLRLSINQLRIVNKTAGAVTFSLWIGASAAADAGTELASAISVPAHAEYNMYFAKGLPLDVADFLVGGASAATSLSIEGYGEIGVA